MAGRVVAELSRDGQSLAQINLPPSNGPVSGRVMELKSELMAFLGSYMKSQNISTAGDEPNLMEEPNEEAPTAKKGSKKRKDTE